MGSLAGRQDVPLNAETNLLAGRVGVCPLLVALDCPAIKKTSPIPTAAMVSSAIIWPAKFMADTCKEYHPPAGHWISSLKESPSRYLKFTDCAGTLENGLSPEMMDTLTDSVPDGATISKGTLPRVSECL
jgi:hypothetical protein